MDNLVLSQLAMIRWEALPIPDEKPRLGALGSSLSAEAFKPGITWFQVVPLDFSGLRLE